MAKKRISVDDDFEELDTAFTPETAASKLPVDISKGQKSIDGQYMEIPLELIDVYSGKKDSDFAKYSDEQYTRFVASIKEHGVLEAITVRAKPDGRYELLAGETRWNGSKDAGLQLIPAHILKNISDRTMDAYFTLTNLLRREISIVDKINGWWIYLSSAGTEALEEVLGEESLNPSDISLRTIQRYAKMHDLIPEFIGKMSDGKMSGRVGYQLAFLSHTHQKEVAGLNKTVSESAAKSLRELEANGEWSKEVLKAVFTGKQQDTAVVATPIAVVAKKLMKKMLRPEDYHRAGDIFEKALTLYFEQHPDEKLPPEEPKKRGRKKKTE